MCRLTYLSPGHLEYVEGPDARLGGDAGAVVRPVASTTCELDRAIIAGLAPYPPPFAIGHEAGAEVVDVGDDVAGLTPGDLVVVPWHVSCSGCDQCLAGRPTHCERTPPMAMFGRPVGGDFGGLFDDASESTSTTRRRCRS